MSRHMYVAGFTMTEIMIVVAIIGLLCAIALPAFAQVRARSARTTCINNLQKMYEAKAQWALETGRGMGARPRDRDLFGPALYIRVKPECPARGEYELKKVKEAPTCSVEGHELPQQDDTPGDPRRPRCMPSRHFSAE